jgi:hypothetical protein
MARDAAMIAAAWMVIAKDGFVSLHKDRAAADRYAVACHGAVEPLFRAHVCPRCGEHDQAILARSSEPQR